MRPPIENIVALGFGAEIIYSFIIIACSLMIYYATRELYELSSYKGIKYFRQAFLFFAIAYFFRSFIKFILFYFNIREIFDFNPRFFGAFTLFIFMYFSSIAIFYLVYSIMWKKWNGSSKKIYIFHAISLLIALIGIISRTHLAYLIINILILAFVIVTLIYSRKETEKHRQTGLYMIYILLFIFWILNVIDTLIPMFLESVRLFIYLISSGIFLTIVYRVLRKSGD